MDYQKPLNHLTQVQTALSHQENEAALLHSPLYLRDFTKTIMAI